MTIAVTTCLSWFAANAVANRLPAPLPAESLAMLNVSFADGSTGLGTPRCQLAGRELLAAAGGAAGTATSEMRVTWERATWKVLLACETSQNGDESVSAGTHLAASASPDSGDDLSN